MTKLPAVLVFTIIYDKKDYCLPKFLEHAKALNYPNKRHIFIDNSTTPHYTRKLKAMGLETYHVERGNNSREALARSQNLARKIALEENYDYLFSLESDVMVPPDTIQRLLIHGKMVATGWYLIGSSNKETGQQVRIPCITLSEFIPHLGINGTRLLKIDEIPKFTKAGLKQVQAGGFGCCLMHRDAFSKCAFTYDPRFSGHSDIYFFNDMFMKRIPVFVDTDLQCDHDNSNWLDVKDR